MGKQYTNIILTNDLNFENFCVVSWLMISLKERWLKAYSSITNNPNILLRICYVLWLNSMVLFCCLKYKFRLAFCKYLFVVVFSTMLNCKMKYMLFPIRFCFNWFFLLFHCSQESIKTEKEKTTLIKRI